MPVVSIHFRHELLLLDSSGAVFWPAKRVLIVADLHLEKSTAAAMQGSLLPPYDTRATLEKLQRAVRRYHPAVLVFLGDSFHDATGSSRLSPKDRKALMSMALEVHFIWITGNHDPGLPGLPGDVVAQWQEGIFRFRHHAEDQTEGVEISGHFHPKASVVTQVRRVSRPCFAIDEYRLILPAFGTYTGGLDVRAPAIARLFPRGLRVVLLGGERLFSFFLPPLAKKSTGADPAET
jgi:DNA ligase-associated metallophosphoesterase